MATAHNSCTKGHGYMRLLLGSVIFRQAGDTPSQNQYYISRSSYVKHKIWLWKIWRIYGHSPNLPTFPPTKVSLHTVAHFSSAKYHLEALEIASNFNLIINNKTPSIRHQTDSIVSQRIQQN